MKIFQLLFISISLISCAEESNSILQENQEILQSGEYFINQSWDQESSWFERSFVVNVPQIPLETYGVVIGLHGGGGNASSIINQYDFFTDKIIIAPQGYLNGWNVVNEHSNAPDVEFVKEIINYMVKIPKLIDSVTNCKAPQFHSYLYNMGYMNIRYIHVYYL